jgi:hypothetical protein
MATYTELYQGLLAQLNNELNQSTINAANVAYITKAINNMNSKVNENTITVVAGETIVKNECVFIAREGNPDGYTAGKAYKTNSSSTSKSIDAVVIGVAKNAAGVDENLVIQICGDITGFSGLKPGSLYYIGSVSGTLSTSNVQTNLLAVGYAVEDDILRLYDKRERKMLEHVGYGGETTFPANCIYFAGGIACAGYPNPKNAYISKLSNDNTCYSLSSYFSSIIPSYGAAKISSSIYYSGNNGICKLSNEIASTVSASFSVTRTWSCGGNISSSAYFAGAYYTTGGNEYLYNSIDKIVSDTQCSAISATLSATKGTCFCTNLSSSLYIAGGKAGFTTYLSNPVLKNATAPTNVINKLISDTVCSTVSATLINSKASGVGITINSSAYFCGGILSSGTGFQGGFTTQYNSIQKLTGDSSISTISATMCNLSGDCSGSTISSTGYFGCSGGDWINQNFGGYVDHIISKLTSDTNCSATNVSIGKNMVGAEAACNL